MLKLYYSLMGSSAPVLRSLLRRRCRKGKEDPARLSERMGQPGINRPDGNLAWIHAASVGESQSALILIETLIQKNKDINILVTTGTLTSAELMAGRLPPQAIHQYYPLDHPAWVENFINHWQPNLVLWMESEIWPNMLKTIQQKAIPAALINARLSKKSFKRWKRTGNGIHALLSAFDLCLAQTPEDAAFFKTLGGENVLVGDNLKYSATPLPHNESELKKLRTAIAERPVWLYASTHDGEEDIACRLHKHLTKKIPDLLTIIVPRHPARRESIRKICEKYDLQFRLRSTHPSPPQPSDQIYIADTMGELGLFYRLCPLACIGRSFSHDGGGGHNPVEAAQLDCAVLHGPHIQNLAAIYAEMDNAGAALSLKNEQDFQNRLERLLTDSEGLEALQNKATRFTQEKEKILDKTMQELNPLLDKSGIIAKQVKKECA